MSIKRQSYARSGTMKVSQSQISQTASWNPQVKIHRANIICRILHSYCCSRQQDGFLRISLRARDHIQGHKKMSVAMNSLFRRNGYQSKFNAFYRLKRQSLVAGDKDIKQAEAKLKKMGRSASNFIFLMLKGKRKDILHDCFRKIKQVGDFQFYENRSTQRKTIRKIQEILLKNKKIAFNRLVTTTIIHQRKQKMQIIFQMLKSRRRQNLQWAMWRFSRNSLYRKKQLLREDIKQFEQKIQNHKDPQMQALKLKQQKLQQHLDKVIKQKIQMQQQYANQFGEIQSQKDELSRKLRELQQSNAQLEKQIVHTEQQINAAYSLDEIYQMVYNNLLLYLHENKQAVYDKQKILEAMTVPLVPVQVPVERIKQQNQVMKELLDEYIVMFGPKKLQSPIEMPYEYLLKQNHAMYKVLVTLLPQMNKDGEVLQALRDNVVKINAKVNELWGNDA